MKKLLMSLVFIGLLISCNTKEKKEIVTTPNIIIIYADDLGWADVGYNNNQYYETPSIDKLAAEGLILNRFYPSAANCAPSRACMMSGKFTPRHGVYIPQGLSRGGTIEEMRFKVPTIGADSSFNTFPVSINQLAPDFMSLAELLNQADYKTARFGKWHIGGDNQGFDINSANGEIGNITNYGKSEKRFYSDTLVAEKLTSASIEFIKKNKQKPFFLYLAHWEVHGPKAAMKDRISYYQNKKDSLGYAKYDAVYAAEVEQLDISVKRIYETLKAENLLENTLLIFTSDNGGVSDNTPNYPLRAGKGTFYEGGIRTPCFMYWKGVITQGRVSDQPVNGVDFMPTFAEFSGIDLLKEKFDGESIVPLLLGKEYKREKPIFFHFPLYIGGGGNDKQLPSYKGKENYWRAVPLSVIMKDEWKLIKYYEYDKVELFNLEHDISENKDLSAVEIEKKTELLNELNAWIEKTNAPIPSVFNK